MAVKKSKKKPQVRDEDKEKILEEVDIALSEATIRERPEEKEEQPPAEEEIPVEDKKQEENQEQQGLDTEPSVESIFARPPEDGESPKKSKKTSFLIIVGCLCIISLLAGFVGGYFYGKGFEFNLTPAPTPTPEAPIPTPTVEEIDLSAYSIEILNGSGTAGVAGEEKDTLESDGFKVGNIGNASSQDYTETSISSKPDVPEAFLDKLKESLSSRYVISTDAGELERENDYDVVVTLGSETVVDE